MKSLIYAIAGKVKNFDDFIDMCAKSGVNKIEVELLHEETINPMCILRHLIARFSSVVSGKEVTAEKIMGACIAHECEKSQINSLKKANEKLEKCLDKLKKIGMEIDGTESRFDESAIYRFCVIHEVNPEAKVVKKNKRKSSKMLYKPAHNNS
jgi:hypothetical protein